MNEQEIERYKSIQTRLIIAPDEGNEREIERMFAVRYQLCFDIGHRVIEEYKKSKVKA